MIRALKFFSLKSRLEGFAISILQNNYFLYDSSMCVNVRLKTKGQQGPKLSNKALEFMIRTKIFRFMIRTKKLFCPQFIIHITYHINIPYVCVSWLDFMILYYVYEIKSYCTHLLSSLDWYSCMQVQTALFSISQTSEHKYDSILLNPQPILVHVHNIVYAFDLNMLCPSEFELLEPCHSRRWSVGRLFIFTCFMLYT